MKANLITKTLCLLLLLMAKNAVAQINTSIQFNGSTYYAVSNTPSAGISYTNAKLNIIFLHLLEQFIGFDE
jgi:hypothetical protein